ncbi:MAG TPA: hypothetical protein VL336_10265 [Sphingomicrobium sp.]|jgi:hypothetical protein|nr:hypothetical protein [Sphingomicrobium sp.]
MNVKPWWVWACEIVAGTCAVALVFMLVAYAKGGTDSPNLPFTSSGARVILIGVGGSLTIVALLRWARDTDGGLAEFLAFLAWWR